MRDFYRIYYRGFRKNGKFSSRKNYWQLTAAFNITCVTQKMKIRPEKLAVNISNLTGGKNEKARRGSLHEKLRLDLFCLQETLNGNQNN